MSDMPPAEQETKSFRIPRWAFTISGSVALATVGAGTMATAYNTLEGPVMLGEVIGQALGAIF